MQYEDKSQLVVDEQGALRRVGDDRELYNELMEMFLDQSSRQLEQLKEAIKNNSADSVEKLAHSIKGAAANLGVLLVQQSAFNLERIGNQNKMEQAEPSLNKLAFELERVKKYWIN